MRLPAAALRVLLEGQMRKATVSYFAGLTVSKSSTDLPK